MTLMREQIAEKLATSPTAISPRIVVMDFLKRPLLLEGDAAAVSKTDVAKGLAAIHSSELIRLQNYEGLACQAAPDVGGDEKCWLRDQAPQTLIFPARAGRTRSAQRGSWPQPRSRWSASHRREQGPVGCPAIASRRPRGRQRRAPVR
jgi:hypothetical protein